DARGLPLPDASVDLAWSSLLVHHLDEPGIVASLAEMRRVTRIGFVVSDLRRSIPALASVWILTRLTSRNRLTLNDGPLSVRRSLKPGEVRALAAKAGLQPCRGGEGSGFTLRRLGAARWLLVHRNPG
ncbi:MAG TPA: methyltransferase domain-containing protein, partial [Candidatus Saccharimonadales bacterium]|nr:methyltransferase domain-containing protein [Candidatus Saccharimonadales bacterium]